LMIAITLQIGKYHRTYSVVPTGPRAQLFANAVPWQVSSLPATRPLHTVR
jgi:hypothetical protein